MATKRSATIHFILLCYHGSSRDETGNASQRFRNFVTAATCS